MKDTEIRMYIDEATAKLDSLVNITMSMFLVSIVLVILAFMGL